MKSHQEYASMNPWKSWRGVFAALTLCLSALTAHAENAIQAINGTQQAGAEVLRIELSEPLAAVPAGFAVQAPPRIAIDLPGIGNAMGRSTVDVNQGNLRSVSIAQSGERTRLVLNLRQPSTYKAMLQGKTLLVILQEPTAQSEVAPSGATGAAVKFAENLNKEEMPLRNIDFRRGADGAGRVIVDLPNNQVGVDIRQQGQGLVVELQKTTLPDNLRKRFDVTDFGTPVQFVTASQVGDRVELKIDARGNWEHSAYQSDNQFVVEVRNRKVDPNKLTQGPGYSGEKLSLNFQNIEVRALLQVIADFTNFNVVTSDSVTGNVTLRLKDVPWDQALDIILQAKGLGVKKSGNVLWIAPKDEITAKDKMDLEAKKQIADLEPLRTQAFQLNYTKAEDVAKGLTGQQQGSSGGSTTTKILSARGSVLYETRTNQLFVTDIPQVLEQVQDLITKIDIPVRQVLIEARIVEATDSFGRSLGVRLGAIDAHDSSQAGWGIGNGRVAIGGTYNGIGASTGQPAATGVFPTDTYFVNLPANDVSGTGAAVPSIALSLFGAGTQRFLNLELSALEADGQGKIISSPRVITADQVQAVIEQGKEIPYKQDTSSGATSISFKKANLSLVVTPQITPEGSILMDVEINNDSKGEDTAAGPAINTKHIKTQVLVENGGTVVIGGIYVQQDSAQEDKVPLLGDVPFLGNLFKTRTKSSAKDELLVFLTPRVVTERAALR
jgi:type IV pilus assembly protein PilQ